MSPETIIHLIETAARAESKSPVTIGRLATGDGGFYGRLRDGHDITTRRAARITQWLSDHWPPDTGWPDDIPRPPPSPEAGEDVAARDTEAAA